MITKQKCVCPFSPVSVHSGPTDGHDSTPAQTSSELTNSCLTRHVFTGGGGNQATHRGASEKSGHTSHFVGGSIPLFAPFADVAGKVPSLFLRAFGHYSFQSSGTKHYTGQIL